MGVRSTMTDRLSLANALAEAKIDRPAAERIATEIFDAIHDNVATKTDLDQLRAATKTDLDQLRAATKADLDQLRAATKQDLLELEHRLTVRFASVMVVLLGVLFAALRYLPPAH